MKKLLKKSDGQVQAPTVGSVEAKKKAQSKAVEKLKPVKKKKVSGKKAPAKKVAAKKK